jgi:general L-amino acid transport system permease protein
MSIGEILRTLIFGFPVTAEFVDPAWPTLLQTTGGLTLSIAVTIAALVLGLPLGALLAAGRARGPATSRYAVRIAIETVRGLPVILLVLLVFHLPWPLLGVRVPGAVLAVVAFTLFAASYAAHIVRSGFRAVGEELVDAAKVLGLSRAQIYFRVKVPIAFRAMRPALLGLSITVFKDTSVLVVVGVPDLTWTARQLTVARPVDLLLVLFLLLVIYGGCASLASLLLSKQKGFES